MTPRAAKAASTIEQLLFDLDDAETQELVDWFKFTY